MKIQALLLLVTMVGCSTNVSTMQEREIASVNSKIRFFETRIEEESEKPSKLNCESKYCYFIEVEVANDLLNISSCSVSRKSLYDGVDPEKSVLKKDLSSKCKSILSNYDLSPTVLNSLRDQLSTDKISGRDTKAIILSGSQAVYGGAATILLGGLTVLSALNPTFPIFVLTGPATVVSTGVAYRGGRDFLTELKGQTRVIYKSGSAEKILNSFGSGGVSTFYVASINNSFFTSFTANNYERFESAWKRYAKDLEKLQKGEVAESFKEPYFMEMPI